MGSMRLTAAVLLAILPTNVVTHYMWMSRAGDETAITFSENPAAPGISTFLKMVSNRTTAQIEVAPDTTAKPLDLKLTTLGGGPNAELAAPLPMVVNTTATMLEGSAVWGLFPEMNKSSPPLLLYWFSAHHTTKPNDWFFIDAHTANRLSVTLRADLPCTVPDIAKVAAVTRLDGQNLGGVEVKLFDASGKSDRSVNSSTHGVATFEAPSGKMLYAMIKHMEHRPGTDPVTGKGYEMIAHFATASLMTECTPSADASLSPQATEDAAAETARWMVEEGDWGYVTSLDGSAPEAEVLSFGSSKGRLFFYIMGDFSASLAARGGSGDNDAWRASLTFSQAVFDHTTSCVAAQIDPEDPRCAKITFTGKMTKSSGDDIKIGRAALFARHPQMKTWPASHGFAVYELLLADIWMIDSYGGGSTPSPKSYFAAKPKHNVPHWPPAASMLTGGPAAPLVPDPPPYQQYAKRARWLVYHSLWSSIGTVSVHLNGAPWGNVRSVADGLGANSTGLPYLYLPTPDPSAVDVRANPNVTLSFSEAALAERVSAAGSPCGGMDAEDPTCARLHLFGTLKALTSDPAKALAAATMCARHPLATWLCHGGAHTGGAWYVLQPSSLVFLDYYGGAAKLSVEEYLAASPATA